VRNAICIGVVTQMLDVVETHGGFSRGYTATTSGCRNTAFAMKKRRADDGAATGMHERIVHERESDDCKAHHWYRFALMLDAKPLKGRDPAVRAAISTHRQFCWTGRTHQRSTVAGRSISGRQKFFAKSCRFAGSCVQSLTMAAVMPVFRDAFKAETVLVTGANGYVASWLVRALLDSGFESVVGGDLSLPAKADPRARYVVLDVTIPSSLSAAMVGVRTVFHCAALVPFNLSRRYGESELQRVNVEGTAALVAAAKAAGVRQLLYVSSTGAVFSGRPIAGEGEETAVVPPAGSKLNDAYSDSKAAAERLVLDGGVV
jgi:hypothetical protein